jgi:hypothetical protein
MRCPLIVSRRGRLLETKGRRMIHIISPNETEKEADIDDLPRGTVITVSSGSCVSLPRGLFFTGSNGRLVVGNVELQTKEARLIEGPSI